MRIMRIHIGCTLALTACLLTGNAAAATYKCTQAGKTIISDLPCAAGNEDRARHPGQALPAMPRRSP